MKRLSLILLFVCCFWCGVFADVTIDKEHCTITKDGKIFPLYGTVKVVESGSADLIVKAVESGSRDLDVKIIDNGSTNECGEWKIVESGSCDFTIKFVESGSADLEIKVIAGGKSGISD